MNSPSTMAVAPHTWWPSRSKYGILDRDAFAHPGALADARGVAQIVQRHFEDLFHFPGRRLEVRPPIGDADNRVQREAADQDVHRRQLTEDPHPRRIHADFLGRFAQRRLGQRLPRIGGAARAG